MIYFEGEIFMILLQIMLQDILQIEFFLWKILFILEIFKKNLLM